MNCDEDICVSHTAGCGVPDTTPAPEIMYKHAQRAQKKKKKKIFCLGDYAVGPICGEKGNSE